MKRKVIVRIGGLALLLGFGLMGALAGAIAFGLPGEDEGPRDSLSGDGLLASSRERLAVCIQAAEGADLDISVARRAVEDALARIARGPEWAAAGLDVAPPAVAVGCPSAPFLLTSGRPSTGKPAGDPELQEVKEASEYRVFLFVLPPPVIDDLFPDGTVRVEPQEFLCDRGTCAEVTTGLYLTPGEVNDPETLSQWLARALGLGPLVSEEPSTSEPTQR